VPVDAATDPAEAATIEERLWSELMNPPASPAIDSVSTAIPAEMAVSPPGLPEATPEVTISPGDDIADVVAGATAEAVTSDEARAERVGTETVGTEAA
jgi:hypothetical protein